MIKNYLKIALRNLYKNKGYSAINIGGLAMGMAVAMLVGLWIKDELSFNSYFKNHARLAQVMLNQTVEGETYTGATIAMPLGDALRTQHAGDFDHVALASYKGSHIISVKDKRLSINGMWAQSTLPKMFTFKMMKGNMDELKDPNSVLINASLATSLFGNDDPVNQFVRLNSRLNLKVAGVYEDMPRNTLFYNTQILLPWANQENWLNKQTAWDSHDGQLFVQLSPKADFEQVNARIRNIPTPYITDVKEEVMLHALDDLHLYDEFKNGKIAGGRIQFVWLFGFVGVFVLLLACINFMNLSTARNEKRAKEVGIRKAIGSLRGQLVSQFMSEAMTVAFLSLIVSLLLVLTSLSFFNELADKQMLIAWNSPLFWLSILGFTLLTGFISGSYPAFYLSSFEPVKVLKGVVRFGTLAMLPRKVLVVIQFTVSITLIIGTIVVYQQIQYAKSRPVGYTREQLITVPLTTGLFGKYNVLRQDLLQTGAVENMAESSQSASYFSNNNSIEWRGKDPALPTFFRDVNVTHDFGQTIGWSIAKGRDFSRSYPTDSQAVIMNESALKIMQLKDPIGEVIRYFGKNYTIVGVARDMLTQSPYEKMEPTIFLCSGWMGVITIRLQQNVPTDQALAKVQAVFKKHDTESPFDYQFLDQQYAAKFSNEVRIGNLATLFAALAILISCLGLFGLASFVAEQRTKEIGIRKVLGASVANLWQMLSSDFVTLVLISSLIACPIAWYVMKGWLQQYEFRTEISWWVFGATALGALIITLLTVSYQSIKAALLNPVKSLKSE